MTMENNDGLNLTPHPPEAYGVKSTDANSHCSASSVSVPSDTERLIWLQRHMKGSEMRRLGIVMNWTGDTEEFRQKIDEKLAQNSRGHS